LTRIAARTAPFLSGTAGNRRFIGFAAAVVVYNNLAILWRAAGAEPILNSLNSILLWGAIFGWWIWVERLGLADLGFRLENLQKSLAWGLVAGVAMAVPAVVFFAFPIILPQQVQFARYADVDPSSVSFVALFLVLLSTAAIFEEVLFRGLIQVRGIRWLGPARGIGLSCGLFILWHVVVTYQSIQQTNLTAAILPWPILYGAAAVPVGVAGLVLSLIRYRTANLAGPIVAHCLVNSLMQGFLIFLSAGTRASA
jgi:membrane protease YdiL (CAAX protease family)